MIKTAKEVCEEIENKRLNDLIECIIGCRGDVYFRCYDSYGATIREHKEKLESLGYKIEKIDKSFDWTTGILWWRKTERVESYDWHISACGGDS